MLTILTPLRGDPLLTQRWLAALAVQNATLKAKVIATVNNAADEQLVRDAGGTALLVASWIKADEADRILYAAELFRLMIEAAPEGNVVMWDDDVLPPVGALDRLAADIDAAASDVAGVVTVYPYRYKGATNQACLFMQPFSRAGVMMRSVPIAGLHRVWGGGTGFSIWRRESIHRTLPWKVIEEHGEINGTDQHIALSLHKKELVTLADCSIRCRHDFDPL